MIVRARAPLRISFAGGGTDVSPYAEERGGLVLNATIDKYSLASLLPLPSREILVHSVDYDVVAKYDVDAPLPRGGRLELVNAAINRLAAGRPSEGLAVYLQTDAPPGSGLGSSSSLVVALVGLFGCWQQLGLSQHEIAELAYTIERQDVAIPGGRQDQYAATFGGFNRMTFERSGTQVERLPLPWSTIDELNCNLLLCYTGKTRTSSGIIAAQVANYKAGKPDVEHAMAELKAIADAMSKALLQARLADFGDLLHQAWLHKQRLASQIVTSEILELYESALRAGALGGKISGAGGGGFMMFYCPFDKRNRIAAALEERGARVVDYHFEFRGLHTWVAEGP